MLGCFCFHLAGIRSVIQGITPTYAFGLKEGLKERRNEGVSMSYQPTWCRLTRTSFLPGSIFNIGLGANKRHLLRSTLRRKGRFAISMVNRKSNFNLFFWKKISKALLNGLFLLDFC